MYSQLNRVNTPIRGRSWSWTLEAIRNMRLIWACCVFFFWVSQSSMLVFFWIRFVLELTVNEESPLQRRKKCETQLIRKHWESWFVNEPEVGLSTKLSGRPLRLPLEGGRFRYSNLILSQNIEKGQSNNVFIPIEHWWWESDEDPYRECWEHTPQWH